MRKILVLGTSAAAQYVQEYYAGKCVVDVIGRTTTPRFDLFDQTTWPSAALLAEYTEVHYTVHAQVGYEQIKAMAELLRWIAQHPVRLIAYTSGWSSITLTEDSRWRWLPYKIVKAAMNMTCKVLAHQQETQAQILLFHPGSFASRMNPTERLDGREVMAKALANLDAWDGQFKFMDGKTGKSLPF